jgi:hypothetical protein
VQGMDVCIPPVPAQADKSITAITGINNLIIFRSPYQFEVND